MSGSSLKSFSVADLEAAIAGVIADKTGKNCTVMLRRIDCSLTGNGVISACGEQADIELTVSLKNIPPPADESIPF